MAIDLKKIIRIIVPAVMMLAGTGLPAAALNYDKLENIQYKSSPDDAYVNERCKLDIYRTSEDTDCPVVVWFHGGGLTGGNKSVSTKLLDSGYVVVAVNYRLLPKVTVDECLDDCAAAVAWTFRNIAEYGGSAEKIFISGHSAGGYITAMLGLDKSWLGAYGIDADKVAGLIPFSGQVISHFSYREMIGIPNLQPTIDRYAPLYHVRKDAPLLVLITGDREIELFGRYEENAYLYRMMKLVGHDKTYLYEIDGHGHGAMMAPSYHILHWHIDQALNGPDATVKK